MWLGPTTDLTDYLGNNCGKPFFIKSLSKLQGWMPSDLQQLNNKNSEKSSELFQGKEC